MAYCGNHEELKRPELKIRLKKLPVAKTSPLSLRASRSMFVCFSRQAALHIFKTFFNLHCGRRVDWWQEGLKRAKPKCQSGLNDK